MCLDFVEIPNEDEKEGAFFKLVHKHTNPDGSVYYTPQWPFFQRGGGGNLYEGFRNTTVYEIGKTEKVTHRRRILSACPREEYRAGIHGYKTVEIAKKYHYWCKELTLMKFSYKRAVAMDNETIVALEATP